MTQQKQVYRCYVCGNVVEVLTAGVGELTCCGTRMVLLKEKGHKTVQGREKHVPVITLTPPGVRVCVGTQPHPMDPGHFIEWLEVICDGRICRQYLKTQQPAEALFDVPTGDLVVRAYCNKHGLWEASLRRGSPPT
jgi:superoxide reductase